jgi:hypothetical protein
MKRIVSIVAVSFVVISVAVWFVRGKSGVNQDLYPSDTSFSGEWVVYDPVERQPVLMAHYVDGKKHGQEVAWSAYPHSLKTMQYYSNGMLDGECIRYDLDNVPLLRGVFRAGSPYDGTFLMDGFGNIVTTATRSLSIFESALFAARYSNGVLVERGDLGPRGIRR